MDLSDKKLYALNFMRLGLEPFVAMSQAGFTDEEITEAEQDPDFQDDILFEVRQEEIQLLEKLNTAIDIAVDKGSASAIQWKLERINKRWRPSSNLNFPDSGGRGIPVKIIMTSPGEDLEPDINKE